MKQNYCRAPATIYYRLQQDSRPDFRPTFLRILKTFLLVLNIPRSQATVLYSHFQKSYNISHLPILSYMQLYGSLVPLKYNDTFLDFVN